MVRHKRRFIAFKVHSGDHIPTKAAIGRAVRDAILELNGQEKESQSNEVQARFYDQFTSIAIIRTPRDFFPITRAAVEHVMVLGKRNRVSLKILNVNGSPRTCKMWLLKSIRKHYQELLPDSSEEERLLCGKQVYETLSVVESVD